MIGVERIVYSAKNKMRLFFMTVLVMLHGLAYATGEAARYTNEWYCFSTNHLDLGAERSVGISEEMAAHGITFSENNKCFTATEGTCNFITAYASYAVSEDDYNNKSWYKWLNRDFIEKGWNFEMHRVVKADNLEWHVSGFSKKMRGHLVEAVNYQARTPVIAPFGESDFPIEYTIRAVFVKEDESKMLPLVKKTFNSFRHTVPCK